MAVKFTDNSAKVLAMIQANGRAALSAMGEEAVGATVKQMQSGYGKPIRQTGDSQIRNTGVLPIWKKHNFPNRLS